MKKFLDRLKDKGYKISGSKAFFAWRRIHYLQRIYSYSNRKTEIILAGIKKGLEMKTTIYCVIMN